MPGTPEPLKLVALDEEDLAIISTHLQDAIVRVGDIVYLPKERRFALCARRFDWEADPAEPPRRRLAGLHFGCVSGARCKGIDRNNPDAILNLLGITFEPTDAPSGAATLHFSDGAAIRLETECIESQLKDLGPIWEAESRPVHDIEEV